MAAGEEREGSVAPRIPKKTKYRHVLKKNPLKNLRIMMRLNPYAGVQKKTAQLVEADRKKQKQIRSDQRRGIATIDTSTKGRGRPRKTLTLAKGKAKPAKK
ncbi:60S ribosomal protein L4 [Lamellibrachia satsuma]|nr:60S ribosomal protein L4 [Lamellibrachia satsuma]